MEPISSVVVLVVVTAIGVVVVRTTPADAPTSAPRATPTGPLVQSAIHGGSTDRLFEAPSPGRES